jgi:hypothetical protein
VINAPKNLSPSLLVNGEGISSIAQRLLRDAREAFENQDWAQALNLARSANDLCQVSDETLGRGVAQIYLADFYCSVGELGRALEHCEDAYRIFARYATRAQKHNRAVAAYTLGCLYRLQPFADEETILRWYKEALDQFVQAQEYWVTQNAKAYVEKCRRASEWLERQRERILEERILRRSEKQQSSREAARQYRVRLRHILNKQFSVNELKDLCNQLDLDYEVLSPGGKTSKVIALVKYLDRHDRFQQLVTIGQATRSDIAWGEPVLAEGTETADLATADKLPRRAMFDIWCTESEDDRFVSYDNGKGYLLGENYALIDDVVYTFFSVLGQDIPVISNANYHFALPILNEGWALREAEAGDFAFVRLQWSVDENQNRAIVWSRGKGWIPVRFERDAAGHIEFFENPSYIIGGDPKKEAKGYIVVLLKPK